MLKRNTIFRIYKLIGLYICFKTSRLLPSERDTGSKLAIFVGPAVYQDSIRLTKIMEYQLY